MPVSFETIRTEADTYLEVAGRIDEDAARFQIPMQHIGRMEVLQTTQQLVQEELQTCGESRE